MPMPSRGHSKTALSTVKAIRPLGPMISLPVNSWRLFCTAMPHTRVMMSAWVRTPIYFLMTTPLRFPNMPFLRCSEPVAAALLRAWPSPPWRLKAPPPALRRRRSLCVLSGRIQFDLFVLRCRRPKAICFRPPFAHLCPFKFKFSTNEKLSCGDPWRFGRTASKMAYRILAICCFEWAQNGISRLNA